MGNQYIHYFAQNLNFKVVLKVLRVNCRIIIIFVSLFYILLLKEHILYYIVKVVIVYITRSKVLTFMQISIKHTLI